MYRFLITRALLAFVKLTLFTKIFALSSQDNNHVWERVLRAQQKCLSSRVSCFESFPYLDPENCVNRCMSRPCFEKTYSSEPVSRQYCEAAWNWQPIIGNLGSSDRKMDVTCFNIQAWRGWGWLQAISRIQTMCFCRKVARVQDQGKVRVRSTSTIRAVKHCLEHGNLALSSEFIR